MPEEFLQQCQDMLVQRPASRQLALCHAGACATQHRKLQTFIDIEKPVVEVAKPVVTVAAAPVTLPTLPPVSREMIFWLINSLVSRCSRIFAESIASISDL